MPFFTVRTKKVTVRIVKMAELPKNIAIRKAHIARLAPSC